MKTQFKRYFLLFCTLNLSGVSQACNELKITEWPPMMVDNKTELNNILFKDMTVTYNYQLKDVEMDEAVKLRHAQKTFIERSACNNGDIQCLLKKDLEFKFVYRIVDKEILRVDLSKIRCQKLSNKQIFF
ncbi:MAG: hypothetical protein H0U57_06895 [Tatlockia sp.]|nr:hypothetical protein [Tatlockia sp.]